MSKLRRVKLGRPTRQVQANRPIGHNYQRPIESVECRLLFSGSTAIISAANALTFTASSGSDEITVAVSSGTYTITDSSSAVVVDNLGTAAVSGDGTKAVSITGLNSLMFNAGGGATVFAIQSTANPTTIENTSSFESAAQKVQLGVDGSVQGITAPVTIENDLSYTSVTVDDSQDTAGTTATLTATELSGLSPAPIYFGSNSLNSLAIDGGPAGNTFDIDQTPSDVGHAVTTTVNAGNGTDVVNILATAGGSGANLVLAGQNGFDNVFVGFGGSAQMIQGPINLTSTFGLTTLTVDDSSDTTPRTISLTGNEISGLTPSPINFASADLLSLTANGGSGGNSFAFAADSGGFGTTINTGPGQNTVRVSATVGSLAVNGQGGPDAVTVGGVAGFGMQQIEGDVTVTNTGGVSALALDDSQDVDPTDVTVAVDNSAETGTVTGMSPATINFTPDQLASLTVNGGTGGNTFEIGGTVAGITNQYNTGLGPNTTTVATTAGASTLDIVGGGSSDTVDVGESTDGTQSIAGSVNVSNPAGTTTLALNDGPDTVGRTVNVSGGSITGLAPAGIFYTATQVFQIGITGGSGSDTFNVTPVEGTAFDISGNDPTPPASPGDVLNIELTGITGAFNTDTVSTNGHSGIWTFTNAGTVAYSGFEYLTPNADLSVTMSTQPVITEGNLLVYDVTITNNGPNAAPDATITDTAGPDANIGAFNFVSSTSKLSGETGNVNIGTLNAGASAFGTIVIDAQESSYFQNTILASSDYPDLSLPNNTQTLYTTVLAAQLHPTGGRTTTLTAGNTYNGVVGGFTSDNPNAVPGDFSALIHWGDGATSAGTVTPDGAAFDVSGSHQYTKAGTVPMTVNITADGGTTATDNGTVTINPGAASQLVFTQQPTTATAGAGFSTPFVVQVQDAYGNLVTSNSSVVMLTTAFGPTSSTTGIAMTAKAVGGVATFSGFNFTVAGLYELQATDGALTDATSDAVIINPAAAAKLVFDSQPTAVVAGSTFNPSLSVQVQDQYGNQVTTDSSKVMITIATSPSGAKLGGTTSQSAVNGEAPFTNLSVTTAGTYTLKATDGSLTAATSGTITVTPAAAAKLIFTSQPTTATAGKAFSSSYVVDVEDGYGNLVTTDSSTVTLAIASGPSGAKLAGTVTQKAANGVATFGGLSLATAGAYALKATDGSLAAITSGTITVAPAAAAKLVITSQPTTATAGATFGAVIVQVEDGYGNLVTTDTSSVTLAIASSPTGGKLAGTLTEKAVKGVATFTGLSLTIAGKYTFKLTDGSYSSATTGTLTVAAAAAAKLVFTSQPTTNTAGASLSPSLAVTVEDTYGNIVTSATTSISLGINSGPSGGAVTGTTTVKAVNGIATFTGISLKKAGAYALKATGTSLSTAVTTAITVAPAAAAALVITQQPTSGKVNTNLSPGFVVEVVDAYGNLVTSNSSTVTVSVGSGPSGGSLGGTLSVNAVNGIATFAGVQLKKAGTYTLKFGGGSLTAAASKSVIAS